jgi:hypothetical protein
MDRKWSKIERPEAADAIPPLPSREEELAYLDKLERELREQSYYNSGFPPNPSRQYIRDVTHRELELNAQRKRKMLLIGALFSPVAFWLAEKSPAKACPMGIPYRSYPIQYKIRFWSYFLLYEVGFTVAYYYWNLDQKIIEESIWPLNQLRTKKL